MYILVLPDPIFTDKEKKAQSIGQKHGYIIPFKYNWHFIACALLYLMASGHKCMCYEHNVTKYVQQSGEVKIISQFLPYSFFFKMISWSNNLLGLKLHFLSYESEAKSYTFISAT